VCVATRKAPLVVRLSVDVWDKSKNETFFFRKDEEDDDQQDEISSLLVGPIAQSKTIAYGSLVEH